MTQDLVYYTVSIAQVTGSPPSDGFINNLPASALIVPGTGSGTDMETDWPTTLAFSQSIARANLRWNAIVQQLSMTVNPYDINNISAVGATSSTIATAMNFTLVINRPDYLYAYDELNAGAILYNANAINRWIARAMIATINATSFPVLDPTAYTDPNYHYGESLQSITAGPLCVDLPTATSFLTTTLITDVSGPLVYPL
jgi:hypothetical protein